MDLKSLKSNSINSIPESTSKFFSKYTCNGLEGFDELKMVPGTLKAKESLFERLAKIPFVDIEQSISLTINERIIPRIQSEIQKHFFDKVFWSATLKKRGGITYFL